MKQTENLAPVLLLAYNRPDHFWKTIEALRQNTLAPQTDLYVYSDAPRTPDQEKAVNRVRFLAKQITGFKSVSLVFREKNWGLAANVISGVTDLTDRFGKVIVLEDDLVTAPGFLSFMNEALELYKDTPQVMNVQAHVLHTRYCMPETFFIRFANSWGWGTWKRAWDLFEPDGSKLLCRLEQERLTQTFDFGGKYPFTRMLRRQIAGINNSWAIRWNATIFLNNGLSLNAGRSLVKNIGTDGSGTNFTSEAGYYTVLYTGAPLQINPERPLEEDVEARRAIGKVYAYEYSKITKGIRLLRRLFRKMTGN